MKTYVYRKISLLLRELEKFSSLGKAVAAESRVFRSYSTFMKGTWKWPDLILGYLQKVSSILSSRIRKYRRLSEIPEIIGNLKDDVF